MTPAEKSLEAVRALSEGRAPQRVLKCVPLGWQPAVPQRVAIEVLPELLQSKLDHSRRKWGEATDLLAQFREERTGRFTTHDIRRYCEARGCSVSYGAINNAMKRSDARCTGKVGKFFIYEFPPAKPSTKGEL